MGSIQLLFPPFPHTENLCFGLSTLLVLLSFIAFVIMLKCSYLFLFFLTCFFLDGLEVKF